MYKIGTRYFISKEKAVNYYMLQGYGITTAKKYVEKLIAEYSIYIGQPDTAEHETLKLNPSEGRYYIEVQDNPLSGYISK